MTSQPCVSASRREARLFSETPRGGRATHMELVERRADLALTRRDLRKHGLDSIGAFVVLSESPVVSRCAHDSPLTTRGIASAARARAMTSFTGVPRVSSRAVL